MSLWKILGIEPKETAEEPSPEVDSIRKITSELEELEPAKAKYVAAFAYLLGRVAHADLEISKKETRAMERIVMERGHLPEDQAILVVQMAKTQNRLFGHIENFLVTRVFDEIASKEQKFQLLHCLFAVCAADKSISTVEDREIRQIASELKLEHREFIGVRSHYRDYLEVLKNPGSES